MNMYNNLTQQAPMYPTYGYYQRGAVPGQESSIQSSAQSSPAYQMPLMQPNYIKGRPVVSIDEARASQIDLDGSLYVFPDLSNKRIYTKQINLDGTASFNIFELVAPTEPKPAPAYVTKDELDEILASFKASLVENKAQESAPAHSKNQVNKQFNL